MRVFKLVFGALLAFGASWLPAAAQATKERFTDLPAETDIGLGLNAVPFLAYLGNLANGTSNNTLAHDYRFTDHSVTAKYFYREDLALRGRIRIGVNHDTENAFVPDAADPNTQVEDRFRSTRFNLVMGGGLERRRGYGRVQGIYGGELLLSLTSESERYFYGNAFTAAPGPPSADFGTENITLDPTDGALTQRALRRSYGTAFGLGIRGFLGVEYFFAKDLSLGVEFGWGPQFVARGSAHETSERLVKGDVLEQERDTGGGGISLSLDNDTLDGGIFLTAYF